MFFSILHTLLALHHLYYQLCEKLLPFVICSILCVGFVDMCLNILMYHPCYMISLQYIMTCLFAIYSIYF